jgi:parvulin-like peptidyl-prolyl isomerase
MTRRKTEEQAEVPAAEFKPSRADIKKRQLRILLFSVAGVMVLAVAGIILYQTYLAPFRKAVITVDSSVVRMAYFLDRVRMAGNDPSTAVQQLTYEQIVKLEAPKLGVTIPDSAVDGALRDAALASASDNSTQYDVTTEAGFQSWYREQLKNTGLSKAQNRDMVRTGLMASEIQRALVQQVPDTGEQVHLQVIVLGSEADANKVKARLDKGEDFAAVAKEVSLDTQTGPSGGELGWLPAGVIPYDDVVFQLAVGQVSAPAMTDPNTPASSQYLLFRVSEKDAERAIDQGTKQQIAYNSFYYWLNQQMQNHQIVYGLDANTQAWVNWQLSKVKG